MMCKSLLAVEKETLKIMFLKFHSSQAQDHCIVGYRISCGYSTHFGKCMWVFPFIEEVCLQCRLHTSETVGEMWNLCPQSSVESSLHITCLFIRYFG